MRDAEVRGDVITLVGHGLSVGERVNLVFEEGNIEEVYEVLSATANTFTVDVHKQGGVYVYGREVDDFRDVDYAALTTLGISAIQQLDPKIEDIAGELGGDSVGLAKILPGDTEVFVAFGQEYPDQPVVTVTPMDFFTGQYKISGVGVGGFTIVLSEAQQADTSFSWRASGAAETVLQLSNSVAVDFEG